MLHVASNLFNLHGDMYNVLVDRYSGWTEKLRRTDTHSICESLTRWFTEFGWPSFIRTDGGPQFQGELGEYCRANGIKHKLSSAYNPESKGLAEAAVKNMKSLISRCTRAKENIAMAIAAWPNMARDDGISPSQLFFGRIQRPWLPMLNRQTKNGSKYIESKDALSKASWESRNSNTKEYTTLPSGSFALMQCHISKKWERAVHIIWARDNVASYVVKGVSTGKQYIRGRRLLRPHPNPHFFEEAESPNNSVEQELLRKKEPQHIQPPRAAKRMVSRAYFANQTQHVCIRQTHQLQPCNKYPVLWFPHCGNQRQWGPDHPLLASGHLCIICHPGRSLCLAQAMTQSSHPSEKEGGTCYTTKLNRDERTENETMLHV